MRAHLTTAVTVLLPKSQHEWWDGVEAKQMKKISEGQMYVVMPLWHNHWGYTTH